MNRDWMRQHLERFQAACEEYDQENRRSGFNGSPRAEQLYSEINSAVPTVREIVKLLAPDLVERIKPPSHMLGASGAGDAAEQALGILRDQDEWKANLAPDAPSLVADQFHLTVWSAASAIWDTGSYRIAVLQGAVSLSTHIAAKAISGLAERELVNEVFAPADPVSGKTRLHFPGDKKSKTWRSRQDGLHMLAQGAFAGIRNVATHTGDEWTEQVALEQLAVLSVIARWTDETELVK